MCLQQPDTVWAPSQSGSSNPDQTRHTEDLGDTFRDRKQERQNQAFPKEVVSGSTPSHLDRGACEFQVWSLLEKWRLGSCAKVYSSDLLSRDLLSSLSLSPSYPSSRERILPYALCWHLGTLPITRFAQALEFAVHP